MIYIFIYQRRGTDGRLTFYNAPRVLPAPDFLAVHFGGDVGAHHSEGHPLLQFAAVGVVVLVRKLVNFYLVLLDLIYDLQIQEKIHLIKLLMILKLHI